MSDSRPTVLLADDHPLMADSVRRLLEPEHEVIAVVADGRALVAEAEARRPDLVISDISLPELDGIEAARRLRKVVPDIPVLFLSVHTEPSWVRAAFEAGARGYLVKTSAADEIETAVREVLANRFYVSPAVAHAAIVPSLSRAEGSLGVLVVDDNPVVRYYASQILDSVEDIEVVGEAVDGREAVEKASQLRPDVVLMDLEMPEMDGVAAIREILRQRPATRVLMMTATDSDARIAEAVDAGAAGYLSKQLGESDYPDVVRRAHRGETVFPPDIAQRLENAAAAGVAETLTPRELDVVCWATGALSNKEIAAKLGLSVGTVRTHLGNIYAKLGLTNRTELALYAVRLGKAKESKRID